MFSWQKPILQDSKLWFEMTTCFERDWGLYDILKILKCAYIFLITLIENDIFEIGTKTNISNF